MKLQVNIEKRHLFILMFVFVALAAVFVIAQTAPNPGHGFFELAGVAPNCLQVSGWVQCQRLVAAQVGWGAKDVSALAGESWNTNRFLEKNLTDFCLKDGTNCPAQPAGRVVKRAATESCTPAAFLCRKQPQHGDFEFAPAWNGNKWQYLESSVWWDCSWVLCTQ